MEAGEEVDDGNDDCLPPLAEPDAVDEVDEAGDGDEVAELEDDALRPVRVSQSEDMASVAMKDLMTKSRGCVRARPRPRMLCLCVSAPFSVRPRE